MENNPSRRYPRFTYDNAVALGLGQYEWVAGGSMSLATDGLGTSGTVLGPSRFLKGNAAARAMDWREHFLWRYRPKALRFRRIVLSPGRFDRHGDAIVRSHTRNAIHIRALSLDA
jgi:hypothetical protein